MAWLRDYFLHVSSLVHALSPTAISCSGSSFLCFAFGVSPVSARLAVAGFVAGAVLLFFHQVRSLNKNSYVAAACVFDLLLVAADAEAERRCDAGTSGAVLGTRSTIFIASAERVACT